MKKIPTLFVRDENDRSRVTREVTPGCEWVLAGKGRATYKWDGTAMLVSTGAPWKRYDAKNGKQPPDGFIPAQEPDPITGHWPGWLPCDRNNPADRWAWEAFNKQPDLPDGTYELCGPKIGGNPHGLKGHTLIPHGAREIDNGPLNYDAMALFFTVMPPMEGIVWHHPDGRMAKIKRRDFGLPWPVRS